jgi:hypothetical protein
LGPFLLGDVLAAKSKHIGGVGEEGGFVGRIHSLTMFIPKSP